MINSTTHHFRYDYDHPFGMMRSKMIFLVRADDLLFGMTAQKMTFLFKGGAGD